MSKKKKVSKPQEDKHDKFVRVVTPRVKKILKAISLIGNQASSAYAPTVDEVTIMFATIRKKVDDVEKLYLGSSTQEEDFSFDMQ